MTCDNKWRVDNEMSSKLFLGIVSDATISSVHIANEKNIPLIILDTTNHQDIEQAISFHDGIETGRVNTIWGKSIDNKIVTLKIDLIKPVPKEFVVAFDIQKQGGLIDLIINSQLLYIQPGKPKDRLSNTMKAQRLMIEVPSTHFEGEWKKLYCEVMFKYFRKQGLSKKAAKNATNALYIEWGVIRNFRIK